MEFNVESTKACTELKLEKMTRSEYGSNVICSVSYVTCNTYSCFSDNTLSKLIEVEEELLDSNSIFGYESLQSLFDIKLYIHVVSLLLLC